MREIHGVDTKRWQGLVLPCSFIAVGLLIFAFSASGDYGKLIHEETSSYSHIRVREKGDVRSLVFVRDNGHEIVESRINLRSPQELMLAYSRSMFASYLYKPWPKRVLIIGLGGGGMVRFLEHHDPGLAVDVVEIDPVVVDIADKFFGTRPADKINIIVADGFNYLAETDKRYDVIYMDAFLKPSAETDESGIPRKLKTISFFQSLQSKLVEGGLVVFNLNVHSSIDDDIDSIQRAFAHAMIFECPGSGNLVVVGGTAEHVPTAHESDVVALDLDNRFRTRELFQRVLRNLRKSETVAH